MTQEIEAKPIAFYDSTVLPILTGLIICLYIAVYCLSANNRILDFWFQHNTFQTDNVMASVVTHNWQKLPCILFFSTFASISIWQLAGNMYFTWVFGSLTERRLGTISYVTLILLSLIISNSILAWDTHSKTSSSIWYFGPIYLINTVLGSYMVFKPQKKRFNSSVSRPRGEVISREATPDVRAQYETNPWNFILAYLAFQTILHFWVMHTWKDYDTVRLIPSLLSFAIGYATAAALANSAAELSQEDPIKLLAIKRYRELRALDIHHQDAIKGAAKSLGLTEEKVKEWLARTKGKMQIK